MDNMDQTTTFDVTEPVTPSEPAAPQAPAFPAAPEAPAAPAAPAAPGVFADRKNIWNLLGMLVGVAAIIVGIVFLQREFYGASMLDDIAFGGDFYTEIYNAARRIHGLLTHLNDFIEFVKRGFAWTFIFFGCVDICVFGHRLCSAVEAKRKEFEAKN